MLGMLLHLPHSSLCFFFFFLLLLKISYIGHDCKYIPDFLGDTYGKFARRLDLSFNQLRYERRTVHKHVITSMHMLPARVSLAVCRLVTRIFTSGAIELVPWVCRCSECHQSIKELNERYSRADATLGQDKRRNR